jgi:hypothetical protein
MRLLFYTSALFSTIVLRAFYTRDAAYHHLFLLVTSLSLSFHAQADPPRLLRVCDMVTAHIAFGWVLLDLFRLGLMRTLWPFPVAIALLWALEHLSSMEPLRPPLHAALHLASICCVHFVMHHRWSNTFIE